MICAAEAADLPAILELVHRAYAKNLQLGFRFWGAHEPMEDLERDWKRGHVWKMTEEGRMAGTVRLHETEDGALYINRLCVDPDLQASGRGGRLVQFAESEARKRGLRCLRLDTAKPYRELVSWYERRGFLIVGEIQFDVTNYRSVIMEKAL